MDSQALRQLAQCPVCLEVKRDVPIYQVSSISNIHINWYFLHVGIFV